jgi:hypothetical protein
MCGLLEVLVRGLFADLGFTISVFLAVAIAAALAFVSDVPFADCHQHAGDGSFHRTEYGTRSRQQQP